MRLGIVASRFNEDIAGELLKRARDEARRLGAEFEEKSVPGALEIPLALQWMAQSGRYDALVALGAVIRGETPHFDFVAEAAARGLQQLAAEINVALAFGVLTTDTQEQARERADRGRGDKGGEAARAALEQAELFVRLREGRKPTVRGFRLS
jgi:6,7-dimethyl-8-ribityllumazine synthase